MEGGNFSFYLIKAADLGSVNSSNILSYALNPQNASHPTVGQLFVVPQGSYYLVYVFQILIIILSITVLFE